MFCLAIPLISIVVGATYYDYTEDMEYVALPFPNPDSFGGFVGSVVFWDNVAKRYEFWVFQIEQMSNLVGQNEFFNTEFISYHITSDNKISLFVTNYLENSSIELTYYRFWYYEGYDYYSSQSFSRYLTYGETFEYSGPSGCTILPRTFYSYGDITKGLDGSYSTRNCVYTFNNDISPYVFKQMSSDLGEIKLYCSEILEALGQGDSYAPPETTTNAVIDGYNQAEQELMTNQFNNIDNVVDNLPDLNGGDLGTAYNNSFAFISNMMNFVSGNGSGYGSAGPSMAKISGVILLVLSLGFTSFIIGLVNRRKE